MCPSHVPPPLDRKIYDFATKVYAEKVIRIPEVISVYRLGNVNEPGVSDLDLLVVVAEAPPDPQSLSVQRVFAGNEQMLSLFLHDVAVFDESGFLSLPLMYYVSRIEHIAGRRQILPELTRRESLLAAMASIVEFSIPRIHRLGELMRKGAPQHVMILLALSCVHTCNLLTTVDCHCDATNEFALSAKEFYSEYVHSGRSAEIESIVHHARATFAIALDRTSYQCGASRLAPSGASLKDTCRQGRTFFGHSSYGNAPYGEFVEGGLVKTWLWVPPEFYWYYHAYARANGIVGESARRALVPYRDEDSALDQELYIFLMKRAAEYNHRQAFLSSSGFSFSDIRVNPGFAVA